MPEDNHSALCHVGFQQLAGIEIAYKLAWPEWLAKLEPRPIKMPVTPGGVFARCSSESRMCKDYESLEMQTAEDRMQFAQVYELGFISSIASVRPASWQAASNTLYCMLQMALTHYLQIVLLRALFLHPRGGPNLPYFAPVHPLRIHSFPT